MTITIQNYTKQEQQDAAKALEVLSKFLSLVSKEEQLVKVELLNDNSNPIEIPAKIFSLLKEILSMAAHGQGFSLLPNNAELSTNQAADILKVSRPYLIKLLEKGAIPFRKVGKHRRIRLEDLLNYQTESLKKQENALQELAKQGQNLNMGY